MTSERILANKCRGILSESVFQTGSNLRSSNQNIDLGKTIRRRSGFTEPTATIVWRTIQAEKLENRDRRLFYVGLTRAKKEVHMTYSGWYRDVIFHIITNDVKAFFCKIK